MFSLCSNSKRRTCPPRPPGYSSAACRIWRAAAAGPRAILERGDCLTLGDLALSGEDLKALGIPPGPEMGSLLRRLLDAVQEGGVPNQAAALERLALCLWRKEGYKK